MAAGRIRDEDIAAVRERARIDAIVGEYVSLRNAGGGSLKGLCPFHDEKTPSFHVTPSRGFFHCLAGETEVITSEGLRRIRELSGGEHRVLNRRGDWVSAPFRAYGEQRLMRITVTRDGDAKELFATDEHRWFVRATTRRAAIRERLTRDLRPDDRLAAVTPTAAAVAAASQVVSGGPDAGPALEWQPGAAPQLDWTVTAVEWTDRVEEVYCAEVADGHAFVLADNLLTGNCFGCGEGGDVISFLQKHDHLSFTEAVERLADKVGIQLRYEESPGTPAGAPRRSREQRTRLIEAHRDAAAFYADALGSDPEAAPGRRFLDERGFDRGAAEHFGVGYAPRAGDALRKHLRQKGYSDAELIAAGLVAQGRTAPYDRFRGRLLWPIRDLLGDVVGFGARRLYDDDRIEAKYLNTPETPIYKKSHVLYGVDLAKRDIARTQQAVVVEGYTDVMACHLAGVTTAVATCGTAFGEDHTRLLRRLLRDQDEYRGQVIFTFDGDEAGQKAAMRAFEGDQRFVGQTYVAVEPHGLDPCELRQRGGDEAVRELVARHQPMFEFAIRRTLSGFDLDHAEGRTRALDATIPIVARIRDHALRDEYARRVAGWVGAPDELAVVRRVRGMAGAPQRPTRGRRAEPAPPPGQQGLAIPVHGDVEPEILALERAVLRVAIQRPALAGPAFDSLEPDAFRSPVYRAVREIVGKSGGCATQGGGPTWMTSLIESADDEVSRQVLGELAVEPIPADEAALPRYVESVVMRQHEVWVSRQLVTLKAKLQRTDPSEDTEAYNRLFSELMALEKHRRDLRERGLGG